MLEGALEASRSKGGAAAEEVLAERDQLKEDVAAMKRKLMAAETALEAAASYKMKVAKLEAQLAQLKGAK
jgi:seryl-tRNA synthetase